MTVPVIYRSTDANAPVLFGAPTTLITVMDACLLNGYGSTFATGSISNDGTQPADGDTVTIGSITYTFRSSLTGQPAYTIKIETTAALTASCLYAAINNVTSSFAPGTDWSTGTLPHPDVWCSTTGVLTARKGGAAGNSVALSRASAGTPHFSVSGATLTGGGGTDSKAPAGWTKPFSASGQAVYRAPSGGPQHYLYVVDTATGGTGATWQGYRTMSALGTGLNPYPLSACGIGKSFTNDVVAHPWVLVADDRSLIFLVDASATTPSNFAGYLHLFGEFYSLMTSDGYRSLCAGNNQSGGYLAPVSGGRLAVARGVGQVGSAVNMFIGGGQGLGTQVGSGGSSSWMQGGWTFPNAADNSLHVTRITIESGSANSPNLGLRGYVRGLWATDFTGFSTDISDPTNIDGAAGSVFAGRNFVLFQARSGNATGWIAIESTTWDVNV